MFFSFISTTINGTMQISREDLNYSPNGCYIKLGNLKRKMMIFCHLNGSNLISILKNLNFLKLFKVKFKCQFFKVPKYNQLKIKTLLRSS